MVSIFTDLNDLGKVTGLSKLPIFKVKLTTVCEIDYSNLFVCLPGFPNAFLWWAFHALGVLLWDFWGGTVVPLRWHAEEIRRCMWGWARWPSPPPWAKPVFCRRGEKSSRDWEKQATHGLRGLAGGGGGQGGASMSTSEWAQRVRHSVSSSQSQKPRSCRFRSIPLVLWGTPLSWASWSRVFPFMQSEIYRFLISATPRVIIQCSC